MATAFRAAAESKDLDAMMATLADDVVFRSPVVFKPAIGRDAVRRLFGVLLETFEDFHYVDEITDGDRTVLVFNTRVGDRVVEGIDMLRHGPDGLVGEFTVMVRPLSAAIRLAETVGARLAALG